MSISMSYKNAMEMEKWNAKFIYIHKLHCEFSPYVNM